MTGRPASSIWTGSLLDNCSSLDDLHAQFNFASATLLVETSGHTATAEIPCVAHLELNPAMGFELSVVVQPGSGGLSRLVEHNFAASNGLLTLSAMADDQVRWIARCQRTEDGRFDLQADTATFRLAPYYVSATFQSSNASRSAVTELVVDAGTYIPPGDIVSGAFDGPILVQAQESGSLLTEGLRLTHKRSKRFRAIRVDQVDQTFYDTDSLLSCLLDAIGFLNGRRTFARFMRFWNHDRCTTRVFRARDSGSSMWAPVPHGSDHALSRNAWILLHYMLRYFLGSTSGTRRSALARCVAEFHAALRTDYISTRALLANVAVEALVNSYFRGTPPISDAQAGGYKNALATIKNELSELAWNSCCNAVGRLAASTPYNALRELSEAGVITSEQARRWRDDRARLAHGAPSDSQNDLEAFVNAADVFSQLVGSLVGFPGFVEQRTRSGARHTCVPIPPELFREAVLKQ